MGFGKKSKFKKKRSEDTDDDVEITPGGFVGTTPKELRAIVKRSEQREIERKNGSTKRAIKVEDRLMKNLPIKIRDRAMFVARYAEIINERRKLYLIDKANKGREQWAPLIPQYDHDKKPKRADDSFVYDVITSAAHFTWKQCNELISIATKTEFSSKEFTESMHFLHNVILQVLKVEEDEGTLRFTLTDRDATLRSWPVNNNQERSKVKTKKSFGEKRRDDDEEETKVKKKKSRAVEDDADDEDEDEAPKKSKKSKADDDDDGDEDEAPKKSKKNGKDAPAKRKRTAPVELSDTSVIASTSKKREKGGPKQKLLDMVPRKGIKLKSLQKLAVEAELKVSKVKPWVHFLRGYGFLTVDGE